MPSLGTDIRINRTNRIQWINWTNWTIWTQLTGSRTKYRITRTSLRISGLEPDRKLLCYLSQLSMTLEELVKSNSTDHR